MGLTGPKGLLADKPVFLVSSMGGVHEIGETDFLRPYMKQFLGLLGISDIRFISARGLNLGEEARAEAIANAEAEIKAAVGAYQQAKLAREEAA